MKSKKYDDSGPDETSHSNNATRVLFIDHSGEIGGGQLVLEQMATRLPLAVRVAFLSPGPMCDRLADLGIYVTCIRGASGLIALGKETSLVSRLWAMRLLPKLIHQLAGEARQVEVVYANSKKALLPAALAASVARRPLIWHLHDEMHSPRLLPLRGRLSEMLLVWLGNRIATRVISVSQASADTLAHAGGRSDLAVVIHNGVDSANYVQSIDRLEVRRSAGLPEHEPLVGCFGRLTAWKGQIVLIDALAMLPDIHVAVVGGAAFGESGYEAELRERADRLGVLDRVHFLGHRNDISVLMRSVDAIAHTSIEFDPCPLVVIEALHSRTPLVASAVGGVPELVENEVTGLLVPPNDASALATALRRITENVEFGERLADAGRQHAQIYFSIDRVMAEIEREIRAVSVSTK